MNTSSFWCFILFVTVAFAALSKRGLIAIESAHEQTDLPKYLSSPDLTWVYNYSPQPNNSPSSASSYGNFSFVPMLWGAANSNTFLSTIKSGRNYSHVLAFNEPDMPSDVGGTGITVDDAVSIWQSQIQPLKALGYQLGSPAGTTPPALPFEYF